MSKTIKVGKEPAPKKPQPKTRSQEAAADVAVLLRSRNPLLWIVTREEARVESYVIEAARAAAYKPRTWDVGQGVVMNLNGEPEEGTQDPGTALGKIREAAVKKLDATPEPERGVWILRDLPVWLEGPGGASTLRQLRNLARLAPGTPRQTAQAMIILSPSAAVPPELAGHTTVIEWPMPDRAEIAATFDATIDSLPPDRRPRVTPEGRDGAIDAALGLTGEEVQACFSKSLVQLGTIDPPTVSREKKRVVAREGVLEWFDPIPGGLDAVGGMDELKDWLTRRNLAYGAAARTYGLPKPKGAFLAGISGCGKSLTAKASATAFGVPLLRIDLGALKSKFVGDSEQNLRKAFDVIKAIGRCVVWFDEIEKALAGATSGASDGGVSADALGAILTWMQERQGEAFVIATANDISGLPPEFLRKGRFDELFFIDLPNAQERQEVFAAALREYGRGEAKVDLRQLSAATEGFTGAEIAAMIPEAMFTAFEDDAREISTADIIEATKHVVKLSVTAAETIRKMRDWAKDRARAATRPLSTKEAAATSGRTRVLDLEEET